MKTLLEAINITYRIESSFSLFRKNVSAEIIKDISFEIMQAEILGIVGESGCGKTTLAKIISGIIPTTSGEVRNHFANERKSSAVQILFQNSEELINPLRKCKSILYDTCTKLELIREVLSNLGLGDTILNSWGYQLSGGERQRIALARLLLVEPEILILDEPFSAQDYNSKINFVELLKNLNKDKGLTIVCITHELDFLNEFADRIFVMYSGKIIESAKTNEFYHSPMHPYSKFLLESDKYKINREDIKSGTEEETFLCSYFGRCEKSSDLCKTKITITKRNNSVVLCNHPY